MGIGFDANGLCKSYGGRPALSGVTCSFPAGGISAVIGPNGSGKTTLLRLLAGLARPDSGRVVCTLDGQTLADVRALMGRVTLVAQKPALFRMSLRRNVEYGLRARGLPADIVRKWADDALREGGVEGLADAGGLTLSGGEAQRAALVRAYALMADAVLLDEPTSSLDPEGVELAEGLIVRMCRERGSTVIIVTHNLFQARRLSDRVFFLMGGRLVEEGSAAEIFKTPRDPLTRKYISGEMVY